eukprot:5842328-Amphidinium_carterae.1
MILALRAPLRLPWEVGWVAVLTGNTPPPDLLTATTEYVSALRDRANVANHGSFAALQDSVFCRSESAPVVVLAVATPVMSHALDTNRDKHLAVLADWVLQDPSFSRMWSNLLLPMQKIAAWL